MATVSHDAGAETPVLGSLPATILHDLFEQEREGWMSRLLWDTHDASDVAVHAVAARILDGVALRKGRRFEGFLAFQPSRLLARLCSGWIAPSASPEDVRALVSATLRRIPKSSRIEGQIIVLDAQAALDDAFSAEGCEIEARDYLVAPLDADSARVPRGVVLAQVESRMVAECARVLVAAHRFGVESRINASFRTERGAHEYLTDILAGQGCGDVLPGACVVAFLDGHVAGFCLGTEISAAVGHVPQIAVAPAHQGSGLGAALLDASHLAMGRAGCGRVTLSVSCSNERAAGWYRRRGYVPAARFSAYCRDGR